MKNKNKGFTLVELLVVISIIAVLSVAGLSVFTNAKRKARDSTRLAHIKELITVTEQMQGDRTGGDNTVDDDSKIVQGTTCTNGYPVNNEFDYLGDKFVKLSYVDRIPQDPLNLDDYKYRYASDCSTYEYSIKFEFHANNAKSRDDDGDDDTRFEMGFPICNTSSVKQDCEGAEILDTSTASSDIEYS